MLLHLTEGGGRKWPSASKILKEMINVDDAIAWAHDVPGAIETRVELRYALASVGLSMRK